MTLSNALIRTHHITSRKKIAHLKSAAKRLNVHALIRSGGVPGIMYVEGENQAVREWVDVVHGLRYKDYQLVLGAAVKAKAGDGKERTGVMGELSEVESVKEMGAVMDEKGLRDWWRVGMGFDKGE